MTAVTKQPSFGPTRIHFVQKMIREFLTEKETNRSINSNEAAALVQLWRLAKVLTGAGLTAAGHDNVVLVGAFTPEAKSTSLLCQSVWRLQVVSRRTMTTSRVFSSRTSRGSV